MGASKDSHEEREICCDRRNPIEGESIIRCCHCYSAGVEALSDICVTCYHTFLPRELIESNSREPSPSKTYENDDIDLPILVSWQLEGLIQSSGGSHTLSQPQTIDPRSLLLYDSSTLYTCPFDDDNVTSLCEAIIVSDFDNVDLSDPVDYHLALPTTQSNDDSINSTIVDSPSMAATSYIPSDVSGGDLLESTSYLRRAAERTTSTTNEPRMNAQQRNNGSAEDNSTCRNSSKRRNQDNDPDPSDDSSDDSSDDDGRDKKPNKRLKFNKSPKKSSRLLACPYYRYDPIAFQGKICCCGDWPTMSRIK
jgi:hypothetical protein